MFWRRETTPLPIVEPADDVAFGGRAVYTLNQTAPNAVPAIEHHPEDHEGVLETQSAQDFSYFRELESEFFQHRVATRSVVHRAEADCDRSVRKNVWTSPVQRGSGH